MGQLVKVLLQLVGLVVLGRILSPAEFGLVAMVTALVGVADVFRDLGLSSAAIQARTITHGQRSNLFWINSGVGVVLTVLICAAALPISFFYGDERLIAITIGLAPMFFFNGIQTQFQAHLARDLKFIALTASDALSMLVGLVAAIVAALSGLGYWALVIQLVAQSFTLLTARVALARWRPGLPDRGAPTMDFLKYGGNLMGSQLLVYASSSVPNILVGSQFGASQLGYFSRASQLVTFPMNQLFTPVTNVALPVLSRSQDSKEQFERHLLAAQVVLGYAAAGAISLAIVWADPLIPLIFGAPWAPSVPIFQILAVAGAIQAVSYVTYWVFLSKGLTKSHFRYSLMSRSLLIVCVIVGSFFGFESIALGYVVGVGVGWPLSLIWLRRHKVAPIGAMFRAGLRILVLGAVVGIGGATVSIASETLSDWLRMLVSALSMAGIGGLAALVIPAIRRDALVLKTTIAHFDPRRRR